MLRSLQKWESFWIFCKKCCGNSNASVRGETVAFLCRIRNSHVDLCFMAFLPTYLLQLMLNSKNVLSNQSSQLKELQESESQDCKPMEIDELCSQEKKNGKCEKMHLILLQKASTQTHSLLILICFSSIKEKLSDSNKSIVVSAFDLFSAMCSSESCKRTFGKEFSILAF